MLDALHLIRPWALLLLLPALALCLWLVARNSRNTAWRRAIDPALLPHLLDSTDSGGRSRLPLALGLALALGLVALAGPAWERLPQPVQRGGEPLVVVLDLSLSMYAEDVSPSRLARARFRINDVLDSRADALTGLVAYAGSAHVVAPLTDDVRTIRNLLPSLEPAIMPEFGSEPGPALELAGDLLAQAGLPSGEVLLVTDGIARLSDVSDALPGNYRVSVLGVGTAEGAPIPMAFANRPGEWLKDGQGLTVVPTLDADRLRLAARGAGGRYYSLDSPLAGLADGAPGEEAEQGGQSLGSWDRWHDRGPWLLLALLPLVLLLFRRGLLAGVVLATGVAGWPAPAAAWQWADLWQTRDQQAMAAVRAGDPERAAALFEDPAWRASALHWAEQTQQAAALFAELDGATARYNQGTSLAHAGDIEAAMAALREALALDPEHADAQHNLALLEQLQEDQQAQQDAQDQDSQRQGDEQQQDPSQQQMADQGQDSGEQQQGGQESGAEDASSEQQPGERQQQANSQPDPEQTPATEQLALDDSDEAQRQREQAMEQWLRRVPDDPGGLLRRKFRHETQQRYRSGQPRTRRDGTPW